MIKKVIVYVVIYELLTSDYFCKLFDVIAACLDVANLSRLMFDEFITIEK